MSVFITIDDECLSIVASAAYNEASNHSYQQGCITTRKLHVLKTYIYLINSVEMVFQATQILKIK